MIPMPKEAAIWPRQTLLALALAPRPQRVGAGTPAAQALPSVEDTSLRLLRTAGLARGMRVLEAGCVRGALAAMAGELVGAGGRVITLDASAVAARCNLQPLCEQPALIELDAPVDALIGHGLLPRPADAAALLRGLARVVRPGGLLSFQAFADPTDGSDVDELQSAHALTRVFFAAGLPLPRLAVNRCDAGGGVARKLIHAWTRVRIRHEGPPR